MILKNEYKSTSEPTFIEQISEGGGDGIARNVYIAIFKIKLDGMAKTNLKVVCHVYWHWILYEKLI